MSESYGRSVPIQVIKIAVQCVAVKLSRDYLLCGGICNPERFLQTFKHPLTVLVWELTVKSVRVDCYKVCADLPL